MAWLICSVQLAWLMGECQIMQLEGKWKDIDTRGYVLIRNFFSGEELKVQEEKYLLAPQSATKAYYSKMASPSALKLINHKLEKILPVINHETGLHVDRISKGTYFITEQTKIGWHSDFESYYIQQSHKNFLTFWIPIIKPEANKSGLSFIPMDRLLEHAPEIYRAIVGRGATKFYDDHVEYENDGEIARIPSPVAPNEMAVTPEISAGDALVFRPDMFHCTQDDTTKRVALAVRVWNSKDVISKVVLLRMSNVKYRRMLKERGTFAAVLGAFWRWSAPQITLEQLGEFRERVERYELRELFIKIAAYLFLPVILWTYFRAAPRQR
jgi:hypothetical protein